MKTSTARRALILDFDGVIVDSEPAHARAMAMAAAELGIAFTDAHYEDWSRFIGRGDRECVIDLAAESGMTLSEAELARAVDLKARAFRSDEVQRLIRPFPATLEILRGAAGRVPVAVCSGSVGQTVRPMLEKLGVAGLLSAVVVADDVARNKPAPDPYLLAASRLGIEPGSAAAIEDSPTGIASARAAGLYVFGVAHSFARERLTGAHEVHGSTAELDVGRVLG